MDAVDFYGYDFEGGFFLFGDDFIEAPGVFVIYTQKSVLDVGEAANLKEAIETHEHTRDWIKNAGSEDIFVAFYPEDDQQNRTEIEKYLRQKINSQHLLA